MSQTVRGIKNDDLAEQLKKLLFRDCRNSRTEFFELRKVCHDPPHGKTLGGYSCCECSYAKCKHYDDVLYISNESRCYYQATCPQCVLSIEKSCHRFLNCCILRMRLQKAFTTVKQALSFATQCFHFKYECAYIELCIEGNVYENSHCHATRYFLNIDHPESLTSQRLKQLSMSNEIVDKLLLSATVTLLNPVCKPHSNGAKCENCEMQDNVNKGAYYVPLHPKTNDDQIRNKLLFI